METTEDTWQQHVRRAGHHKVRAHTVRSRLRLPCNDHAWLILARPHSTILLAAEVIESGHGVMASNLPEWGRGALANAIAQPD